MSLCEHKTELIDTGYISINSKLSLVVPLGKKNKKKNCIHQKEIKPSGNKNGIYSVK